MGANTPEAESMISGLVSTIQQKIDELQCKLSSVLEPSATVAEGGASGPESPLANRLNRIGDELTWIMGRLQV